MQNNPASAHRLRSAALRWVVYFCLWLVLYGADPVGLAVGAGAAAAATWTSLRLLPPGDTHPSFVKLAGLTLRFFRDSIVAGLDVAWRALDPRLPLRPGFVVCPLRSPPGPMRNAYCMIASLLPGTLPAGPDASGRMVIHCLDTGQSVAAETAADEALFVQAIGAGPADG